MKEKPIRVLEIALTKTGSNGITSFLISSLQEIKKNVSCDFVMVAEPTESVKKAVSKLGGKLYVLSMRNRKPVTYMKELKKIIKEGQYDIVHVNGNSCTMAMEMLPAKWAKAPVRIAHAHNTNCNQKLLHTLLRSTLEKSYTDTAACGTDAGHFLFHDKSFTVLKNGVDTSRFAYSKEAAEEIWKELKAEKRYVILSAGGFNGYKNQKFLLEPFAEAFKEDNSLLLVMAGDGPLLEEVKEKAKELGLDDTAVRFLGRRDDVEKLLSAADLVVMPSLYEGFPISLLEAQASGACCLVSDNITKEAIFSDNIRSLKLEEEDWKNAFLEKKKETPAKRKTGAERVRKNGYDRKDTAEDLLKFYQSKVDRFHKLLVMTRNMAGGGCERVLSQVVNELVDQGIECTVATEYKHDSAFPLDKRVRLISMLDKDSCRGRDVFRIFTNLRKYVKQEKPDIVLAMPDMVNVWTAFFLAGTGVPLVVSERNDPKHFPTNLWKRMLRRPAYHFVDGIIFQTEDQKKCFPKWIQEKGIVLDNPMNIQRVPEPVKNRTKTVVTAARLTAQKNIPMLISAFTAFHAKHNDWNLVIYGDGADMEKLKKSIEKIPGHAISLPGHSNQVREDMKTAGMFVLSSNFEGMPNVLMEAMALGLPCISTDCPVGGPASLIEDDVNGMLVPVGDSSALVKAMCRIAEKPDFAKQLGGNAYKIRKRLDARIVVKEWKEFLNRNI